MITSREGRSSFRAEYRRRVDSDRARRGDERREDRYTQKTLGEAGLRQIQTGSVLAESRRYLPSLKVMLQRRVQQAVDLGAA